MVQNDEQSRRIATVLGDLSEENHDHCMEKFYQHLCAAINRFALIKRFSYDRHSPMRNVGRALNPETRRRERRRIDEGRLAHHHLGNHAAGYRAERQPVVRVAKSEPHVPVHRRGTDHGKHVRRAGT